MLRLLSMSEGTAAKTGGDKKRLVAMTIRTKSPRQRSEDRRSIPLIVSP
jgi:hypothetical protein